MNEIRVVVVPYELGRLRDGVGRGPERLLEFGAEDALASAGATVRTEIIELDDRYGASGLGDVDAAFELIRRVSDRVRGAREEGAFPIVLSGSCFAAVGVVAGLERSRSRAFSGSTRTEISTSPRRRSLATSMAWGSPCSPVAPGRDFSPRCPVRGRCPSQRSSSAGARDLDPAEETRLRASQIVHLSSAQLRSPETLVDALRAVVPESTGIYVHVDLDVLDIEVATVNVYGAPAGLDGDQLDGLLDVVMRTFPVRAVSLTAYDPAHDVEQRVPPIALRLLRTIAQSL